MNKKGFSLIEIILYVGITSVIITGIFSFLFLIQQSRIKSLAINEVEEQGREIMHFINRSIRHSNGITSPVSQSSSSSLVLLGDDDRTFILSNGHMYLSENGATSVPLNTSQVVFSNVSFSNLSKTDTPGIIRVQFDLEHINNDNLQAHEYSRTFYSSTSLRYE